MTTRIGPYEVVRHLGAGGMSMVWLARGPLPGRATDSGLVVLKRQIHKEEDDNLREEARVGMRLQHPGVVRTLGTFDDVEGRPVLILEYVAGASLAQLRKRGALPVAAVASIGACIAEALTALHDARDEKGAALRILHRDVTPANIIVGHEGQARLIDLGIARSSESALERTATGNVKGTLRYVAPELFDGKEHTPSTDLWSLGVCLFEAALGRPAISGPEATVLGAIVRGTILQLRDGEAIEPQLHEVIGRLCTPDTDKRYPHARIAARRLATIAAADAIHPGAMLASVAVYAAVEEPRTNPAVRAGAPAATVEDDGFARMAANTYCGEDDDLFGGGPSGQNETAIVAGPAAERPASVGITPPGKSISSVGQAIPLPVTAIESVLDRFEPLPDVQQTEIYTPSARPAFERQPLQLPLPPVRTTPSPANTPSMAGARTPAPGGPAHVDTWNIPQPITGEDARDRDRDRGAALERLERPAQSSPTQPLAASPTTAPTDEMNVGTGAGYGADPDRTVDGHTVDEPSSQLLDLREQALGAPSVIVVVVVVVAIALGVLFAIAH